MNCVLSFDFFKNWKIEIEHGSLGEKVFDNKVGSFLYFLLINSNRFMSCYSVSFVTMIESI